MTPTDLFTAAGCILTLGLALLSTVGAAMYCDRMNWWTGRSPVAEWAAAVGLAGWSAALLGSGWPPSAGLVLMFCSACAVWRVSRRADVLHGGFTSGDTFGMLVLGSVVAAAMFLSLAYPTVVGALSLLATVVAAYAGWNAALTTPLSRMTVLSPGYSLGVLLAGASWAAAGATQDAHTITLVGAVLIIAGAAALVSGRRTVRRRIR